MAEQIFCTQCGCGVTAPAASEMPVQCPRCAAPLVRPANPLPAPASTTRSSGKTWILFGCAAVLLLALTLIGAGGWFVWQHYYRMVPEQAAAPDEKRPDSIVDTTVPEEKAERVERQEVRRLLQPSQDPQRVEMEGVTVEVPGGLLTEPRELLIATLPKPPSPGEGLELASVYEIRLGDDHVFDQPLTIELPYDPELLRPGMRLKNGIMAGWWNDGLKEWCVLPCTFDEIRKRAIVKTGHLSVFGTLMWAQGWESVEADNFVLYFDRRHHSVPELSKEELEKLQTRTERDKLSPEKVQKIREMLIASKAKESTGVTYNRPLAKPPADLGLADGQWPAWCDPKLNLPPFVRDVGVLLNVAFRRYKDAGFQMPATPLNVRVGAGWGSGGKSSRNKLTGLIFIGFVSSTTTKLAAEASHELFHAIQNEYYWDIGMGGSRLWWLESSAEYAGWTIGAKHPVEQSLPASYLSHALTQTTTSDADNEHEYQTAHFLDFVARLGDPSPKAFHGFFEKVVSEDPARGTAPFQGTLQPFRKAVRLVYDRPMFDVYRDFAASLAFSEGSACKEDPAKFASRSILLKPPAPQTQPPLETWTATLPANGTARVCLVNVKEPGAVQVSLEEKQPVYVTVNAYLLPKGERVAGQPHPVGALADPSDLIDRPLTPDVTMALLCTNTSDSDQTVNMRIGMRAPLTVSLTAIPTNPRTGDKVQLKAQIDGGKPPYRARFATSAVPGGQQAEPVEGKTTARVAQFGTAGPAWAEVTVSDAEPNGAPVTQRVALDIREVPFGARIEAPDKRSPGQPIPVKLVIEGGEPPFACTGVIPVAETRDRELTRELRAKDKGRFRLRATVTDARKREVQAEHSVSIESTFSVQLNGPKQFRPGQEAKIEMSIKGGQAPYQVSVNGKALGALKGAEGHFTYTAGQMPGRAIIEVQVTDATGESNVARLRALILPAKDGDFTVIVQAPNGAIKRGEKGNFTITIAGGQYPYRVVVNGQELPGEKGRVVPFTYQPTTRASVDEVIVLVIDANGGGKLAVREVGVRD